MKKGTNKHSKSKWKHKLLIAIITGFISISGVNAAYYDEHQYKPDAIYNPNRQEPIRQNVSRMDWWGQTGQIDKWAFEYQFNVNDFPSSGTYSVTGAMYFSNAINEFSTPLISAGATYCQITNTYHYSYKIMKDYDLEYIGESQSILEVYEWGNYGTDVSQLVSFTCENVKIPSHGTMYLNVLFPNNIRTLRVTAISVTKSGSTEIVKEQEQMNEKLDEFINSDLSEEDKQKPNQDGFDSYQESENELKDKMEQADLNNISIGIDANSSSWIWDTLTRLIQSHSVVFGMFIAILSIGIIKLALGR